MIEIIENLFQLFQSKKTEKFYNVCQFDIWRREQKKLPEWQRSPVVWISCTCPKCQQHWWSNG